MLVKYNPYFTWSFNVTFIENESLNKTLVHGKNADLHKLCINIQR
jgi:hypothetical protein